MALLFVVYDNNDENVIIYTFFFLVTQNRHHLLWRRGSGMHNGTVKYLWRRFGEWNVKLGFTNVTQVNTATALRLKNPVQIQ